MGDTSVFEVLVRSVRATSGCLIDGTFNVATTATASAGLAGVLAGISILAFVMVLSGHSSLDRVKAGEAERIETGYVLLALFCATFGLAVATLQYSVLAGETGDGLRFGRAASEEIMADISFTTSLLTLLNGFVLLIKPETFRRANIVIRQFSSIAAPTLSLFFICTTAQDIAAGAWASQAGPERADGTIILCGRNGFFDATQTAGIILPLALAGAVIVLFWLLPRWSGERLRDRLQSFVTTHTDAHPIIALVAACAAAAIGVLFDIYDPNSRLNEPEVWSTLVVVTLVFLYQAFFLALSRTAETEPEPERPQPRPDQEFTADQRPWAGLLRSWLSVRRSRAESDWWWPPASRILDRRVGSDGRSAAPSPHQDTAEDERHH